MTGTPAPAPRRIEWRRATVLELVTETPTTRTLVLDVPGWPGHRAGQHVDVRLTAADAYQAERSYSIASAPEEPHLALTIERLEDGEVSSYLCGELQIGDQFELRGPIGGYFVWDVGDGGPLQLVAGGSGIVPLMAMLRYARNIGKSDLVRLLVAALEETLGVRLLQRTTRKLYWAVTVGVPKLAQGRIDLDLHREELPRERDHADEHECDCHRGERRKQRQCESAGS